MQRTWRHQAPQIIIGRGNGNGRGSWKHAQKRERQALKQERKFERQAFKHERKLERQAFKQERQQFKREWKRDRAVARGVPFRNGGFMPPGQIRRAEVHARNAVRRAARSGRVYSDPGYSPQYAPEYYQRYSRDYRDYSPRYTPDRYDTRYLTNPYAYTPVVTYYYQAPVSYAYDPYAYSQYTYYDDRDSWKQMLLRTLIGTVLPAVLGNDGYDSGYAYNGYDSYYAPQYDPYYISPVPYSYAYAEPGAYYDFYQQRPSYTSYHSGPDYRYSNASYGAPYLTTGVPMGTLFNAFPIEALLSQYVRDPYMSDVATYCVAQGYDEGYQAALIAEEYGYIEEDRIPDPYLNEVYDPYSVSIGERRRLLSEGYELGYSDALNGGSRYDPYSGGATDLVSVLLGGVLQQVVS
jgi:hypothetical protein